MKMKYIALMAAGLALLFTSCKEDFAELTNPNQQTTGTYWKTEADALAGVNSVYSTLYYDALYMRMGPWIMDVRADDMHNTSPWWITAVAVYNVTSDNPCYTDPWKYNYVGIFRANQVLDNVPNISMDENLKKRVLAEAKFLRGLFYYHLALLYNNVPIITSLPKNQDEYYVSQSKPAEVWAQIIKDFSDAEADLPKKEAYAADDLGRATKAAAAAYKAKSMMIVNDWAGAEATLKEIITNPTKMGKYILVPNYEDNFTENNENKSENNSESLFEVQFDRNVGGTTLGWANAPAADWSKTSGKARTYAPLGFGYGDITPTDWIFNEFSKEKTVGGEDDPRMKASFFYDYPGSMVYTKTWTAASLAKRDGNNLKIFVKKYLNYKSNVDESEWRSGINERIMRYADVLLMYAECLNELNRTNEAYTYIQIVRDRVKLPDLNTTKPGMSQTQMRAQIAHERALEFCFEGQRYIDILRWKWLYDNTQLQTLIAHDPEFSKWTAGREYLAIPQTQLDINKKLVQNPGWEGN